MLQRLARDVELQVLGVDHAAHEAQVAGHQPFHVLGDEHPPHVELHAMPALRVVQIERLRARHEQERLIRHHAFRPDVQARPGLVEGVRDVVIELLVLLVGDLRFGAGPQRARLVDLLRRLRAAVVLRLAVGLGLGPEQDRDGDVVRVVAHDLAQAPLVEELLGVVAQVQDHRGPARRRVRGLDREAAAAVGLPAPGVLLAGLARDDLDLTRDHERGIEADPELPDQVQVRGLVAAQLLDEALGTGARDGAEIVGQIVAVHADAVVDHRERARGPIGHQHDLQLGILAAAGPARSERRSAAGRRRRRRWRSARAGRSRDAGRAN